MQAVGMEGSGKVTVLRTGKRTRYPPLVACTSALPATRYTSRCENSSAAAKLRQYLYFYTSKQVFLH